MLVPGEMPVQDFAEQCLEKATSRFARSTIIEAYSMSPGQAFPLGQACDVVGRKDCH